MEIDSNHQHICLCPLEGIINVIGKKWAILVISIIGHHEKIRFNEIMHHLEGISPKTLTDVLRDLGNENLIHRESFSEIPPRVEYSLTDDGKQLCEAVLPLIRWVEKRDSAGSPRCRSSCHDGNVPITSGIKKNKK